MAEKNKRLVLDGDIIYPFTKQENVIGLQKTIKEKLPIVSSSEPSEGFVERQAWLELDVGSSVAEDVPVPLNFSLESNRGYFGAQLENNDSEIISTQLEGEEPTQEEAISTQLEENNDQIISTQLEE